MSIDGRALAQLPPVEALAMLKDVGAFGADPEQAESIFQQLQDIVERTGIHPLQLLSSSPGPREEEPMDAVLSSFDLDGIARYIKEHECTKVVVMCGAGISTSAGIPDFRSPGTGLYDNLQRLNLPHPEAVFELSYFRENPSAFYTLAKDLWPGNYEPTPTHYFIKLLHDKGILLRCFSQNIDSLECQTGLPKDRLVAAHGNFDTAHVIDTSPEVLVDLDELKEAVDEGESGWQALRERKGGLVKPKITFFGESLPDRFVDLCDSDLASCDLLIVLGTSLAVQPFCLLVGKAARASPRVLINRDPVGTYEKLPYGFRFQKEGAENWRDVFHAGDCDNSIRLLARALGWEDDLDTLISSKGAADVEKAAWVADR